MVDIDTKWFGLILARSFGLMEMGLYFYYCEDVFILTGYRWRLAALVWMQLIKTFWD
jgi:hypothetical protein